MIPACKQGTLRISFSQAACALLVWVVLALQPVASIFLHTQSNLVEGTCEQSCMCIACIVVLAQHALHLVAFIIPVRRQSGLRFRLRYEGMSKAAYVWHAHTCPLDLCTQTGDVAVSALRELMS